MARFKLSRQLWRRKLVDETFVGHNTRSELMLIACTSGRRQHVLLTICGGTETCNRADEHCLAENGDRLTGRQSIVSRFHLHISIALGIIDLFSIVRVQGGDMGTLRVDHVGFVVCGWRD